MNEELFYLAPEGFADNPRAWGREEMYFSGLAGIDREMEQLTTTPSGYGSAPQGATTPSAQPEQPWYAKIGEALTQALPVAAQAYQVKKVTDLNIDRARQGLAPLSPQQAASMFPAAQVQVGPSDQAQKLMLYAAIGVGGLVLLRALKVI